MLTPVSITSKSKQVRAVVLDQRSIVALIREIIDRSGYTVPQVAEKLGIKPESIYQYYYGYRFNPGVNWLARLAAICGAKLQVELP